MTGNGGIIKRITEYLSPRVGRIADLHGRRPPEGPGTGMRPVNTP